MSIGITETAVAGAPPAEHAAHAVHTIPAARTGRTTADGGARSARRLPAPSPLRRIADVLRGRFVVIVSGIFLAFVAVASAVPQLFTRLDPYKTSPADKLLAPSAQHWFGTDQVGRDLFTRVLYGGRATLLASLISLSIAFVGGLLIGVISGYFGGWIDGLLMRGVDVLLSIPGLLLAITIVTAIGFGTTPVAVAIGIGILPGFARTTRSQVLRVRERSYIEAARVGGVPVTSVIFRHVIPNAIGPVSVLALLDFGSVIMAVATLSFLGFGARPPAAEWGSLINDGRSYLVTSPWVPLLPGLTVVLTVLSITVIAQSLKKRGNL
ncbi:ABC transporter permease [Bifidobacterium amazonense]|uniref:ABC transporter permease n=1 Tax=Bifidobacterium amazonense TaxID=2809027 RepID=A0ABS9VYT9_9BIFI|nr:ABC transporter permease [Bifidobacterium amazonense]MCH9277277.1 ABC transporter permease [Bifidobacterium amazonense]